ncbi:hypothetical protein Micbo1qcDRAFT_174455 [Microdochium bolleyi]|uniref:Uncharacterized protein n=1 Tax=Microdochium bolleyi TaxID=196109 RepID=A0A136J8C0_9PEZI|nr:hypothetical protein Micbo1qcDRAFT_174455 [Microdochium bolleyi]
MAAYSTDAMGQYASLASDRTLRESAVDNGSTLPTTPPQPIPLVTTRQQLNVALPLAALLTIVLSINVVGGLLHEPKPPFFSGYIGSTPIFGFTTIMSLWFGIPLLVCLSRMVTDMGASFLAGVTGAAVVLPVLYAVGVGRGDVGVVLTWAGPSFWLFLGLDLRYKVGVKLTGWLAGVIDRKHGMGRSAVDPELGDYVRLPVTADDGRDVDDRPPSYDGITTAGGDPSQHGAAGSSARAK